MPSHDSNDRLPELTTGQRIRLYRERSGRSRPVLAGLLGKSPEWLKAIETGRQQPPRLHMLAKVAKALRVSVADLTGDMSAPTDILTGPGHPALPALREALNRWAVDDDPQPLGHIQARLDVAWRARHAAPDHRTVIGALLPDLIRDAQVATRAYQGRQRRRAYAMLANALGLAQMYAAFQPDAALVWRISDRAMLAAQESGDLAAMGGATWFAVEAHREAGDWDTAMTVTDDALRVIEPALPDASVELLALWGALQTAGASTAARSGEDGRAWRYWDTADAVARRLPAGYFHPWTSFGAGLMRVHATTLAVELRRGGEALRQARRVDAAAIPSRPRRARHLIEVARGHHLRREHAETLRTLGEAYQTAPETIRYNGPARVIALELLDGPAALRRDAHDLAVQVGLLG